MTITVVSVDTLIRLVLSKYRLMQKHLITKDILGELM